MADDLNVLAGLEGLIGGITQVAVPVLSRRANLKTMMEMEALKSSSANRLSEQSDIRKERRAFETKKSLMPFEIEQYQEKADIDAERQKEVERYKASLLPEKADVKQKAKLKENWGKAEGKYNAAVNTYEKMIRDAENILNDPSLPRSTGLIAQKNVYTRGGRRVAKNLETLKSKTVLSAMSSMKELSSTGATGFGAMNIQEFKALENSITNLDIGLSTPDFKQNLTTFISDANDQLKIIRDTRSRTYGSIFEDNNEFEEE